MTTTQRVVHWGIVAVLSTGFLSALYMVFVVYAVPGAGVGPMYHHAEEVPLDFFLRRRLYGLEAWLTFGFLSVYLALTSLRTSASAD